MGADLGLVWEAGGGAGITFGGGGGFVSVLAAQAGAAAAGGELAVGRERVPEWATGERDATINLSLHFQDRGGAGSAQREPGRGAPLAGVLPRSVPSSGGNGPKVPNMALAPAPARRIASPGCGASVDCHSGLWNGVVFGDILRTAALSLIKSPKKVPLQLRKLSARSPLTVVLHISQVESTRQLAIFPTVVSAGAESPPLQR